MSELRHHIDTQLVGWFYGGALESRPDPSDRQVCSGSPRREGKRDVSTTAPPPRVAGLVRVRSLLLGVFTVAIAIVLGSSDPGLCR